MKTIRFFLLLGAVLAMLGMKGQDVTFTVESGVAPPGNTVIVPVIVDDFTAMGGFSVTITWNETVLDYVSFTDFPLGDLLIPDDGTVTQGELSFIWTDITSVGQSLPDGSVLFNLTFNVIGSLSSISPIDLLISDTYRFDGVIPVPTGSIVNNGMYQVSSSPLFYAEDLTAEQGEIIDVQIKVANFNNVLAVNEMIVKWDPSVLYYNGTNYIYSQEWFGSLSVSDSKLTAFCIFDGTNQLSYPDGTAIITLQFIVVGNPCSVSAINFEFPDSDVNYAVVDNLSNKVPLLGQDGSMTVVNQVEISMNGQNGICGNSPLTLESTPDFDSYLWSTGETSSSISVDTAGTYALTVTNANNCSATSSINVAAYTSPEINLSDETICSGDQASLDAGVWLNYSWSTNETTQVIEVGAGTYTVTVEDFNGCTASKTVMVTEVPLNDIYIRDQDTDTGIEPNPNNYVYASPSIKVNWINGGIIGQWYGNAAITQFDNAQHQGPKYGIDNTVYIQLENRGCESFGQGCQVEIYYKRPSAGTSWPIGWNFIDDITLNSDVLPETAVTVAIRWDKINIPLPAPNTPLHTCLHARWVCATDLITSTLPNTQTNTVNSNNLAWRNVNITTDLNNTGPVMFENVANDTVDMRLNFRFVDAIQNFQNQGNEVHVQPDQQIQDLLSANDPRISYSANLILDGSRLVMTNSDEETWIDIADVPLGVTYQTDFTFNCPNPYDNTQEDSVYYFLTEQFSNGNLDGGVLYDINRWQPDIVPFQPANLYAEAIDQYNVDITWDDQTFDPNTEALILERAIEQTPLQFETLGLLPKNTTTYEDNTVTPNYNYCYRIKSTNIFGTDSEPSDTSCAYTRGFEISGNFMTTNGLNDENTIVSLYNPTDPFGVTTTDVAGNYLFDTDVIEGDYKIIPSKEINYRQDGTSYINVGIDVLDLLFIQAEILNQDPFTEPWQKVAANVTQDQVIDILDYLYAQQAILSNIPSFANDKYWKFIPNDVNMNTFDAFNFDEFVTFTELRNDTIADFTCVKLGDVDGSHTTTLRRSYAGEISVGMASQDAQEGTIIEIPISMQGEQKLAAWQYSHQWDPNVLEFLEVVNPRIEGLSTTDNFGFINTEKGVLSSLFTALPSQSFDLSGAQELYTLRFKVVGLAGNSTQIATTATPTEKLAVNSDMELISINSKESEIHVRKSSNQTQVGGFALYQSKPNPAITSVEIPFDLPSETAVELLIFDVNGLLVKQFNQTFLAGSQSLTWNIDKNLTSGLYYYQIKAGEFTDTRKMILIR